MNTKVQTKTKTMIFLCTLAICSFSSQAAVFEASRPGVTAANTDEWQKTCVLSSRPVQRDGLCIYEKSCTYVHKDYVDDPHPPQLYISGRVPSLVICQADEDGICHIGEACEDQKF